MERSKVIQECINLFKNLPSVGPKTAERFVYHLLNNSKLLDELILVLSKVKEKIVSCRYCNDYSETDPCPICSDEKRERKFLCIVEKHSDIYAIEASGYKGLYYILSPIISPLEGKTVKDLNIKSLYSRIFEVEEKMKPQEIIIALSFTTEGELTTNYIVEQLRKESTNVKISRIAYGLPIGAEIEYADPKTLSFAIKNRISL
jgi:recombination protein RecR